MVSVIGGLLLILGAFFVFKGQIFKSVLTYFFADVCWVYLGWIRGDKIGVIFITIGMFLGLLAYFKMNSGTMEKELKTTYEL